MAMSSRAWTRLLALCAVLFAILGTINALNKGGDAAVFFEGGRRFLHAEPLYEGSSAAAGFIGPPFQAMFFAPFAAVASTSPTTAKLLWHALNLVCLGLGVWLSVSAWDAVRARSGFPYRRWLPMLFAPLFAILLPLQTNFEHQNINALLLALLAGATWQLTLGSAAAAGLLIGVATALKAFPGLLILYLVARRYWRSAITAAASAIVLTAAAPLAVYGVEGFSNLLKSFWRLGNSGWPIRGNNQSLIAALDRLTIGHVRLPIGHVATGFDGAGVRVAGEAPLATGLFVVLALLLVAAVVVVLGTTRRRQVAIPCEIAGVTVLAILLSPIAWDHYWTLMLPAFLILYDSRDSSRLLGRAGHYAFWTAAILTSGLSPLTLGKSGFNLARELSAYTMAALLAYASLLVVCRKLTADNNPRAIEESGVKPTDNTSNNDGGDQ